MNRLRVARVVKGVNQYQLAALTKMHQPQISLIENDLRNPTDGEKLRIAGVLGFGVAEIWPSD